MQTSTFSTVQHGAQKLPLLLYFNAWIFMVDQNTALMPFGRFQNSWEI